MYEGLSSGTPEFNVPEPQWPAVRLADIREPLLCVLVRYQKRHPVIRTNLPSPAHTRLDPASTSTVWNILVCTVVFFFQKNNVFSGVEALIGTTAADGLVYGALVWTTSTGGGLDVIHRCVPFSITWIVSYSSWDTSSLRNVGLSRMIFRDSCWCLQNWWTASRVRGSASPVRSNAFFFFRLACPWSRGQSWSADGVLHVHGMSARQAHKHIQGYDGGYLVCQQRSTSRQQQFWLCCHREMFSGRRRRKIFRTFSS